MPEALSGVTDGDGLHEYLGGHCRGPAASTCGRRPSATRCRPPGRGGRADLVPGRQRPRRVPRGPGHVERCIDLLVRVDEEFDLGIVDLSAGRSYATQIVLAATASPALRHVRSRWLVSTAGHASTSSRPRGLVNGSQGILEAGELLGHDREKLQESIRFVRTAVLEPDAPEQAGLRPEQLTWLNECDKAPAGAGEPGARSAGPPCWARSRWIRCCSGRSNCSPTTPTPSCSTSPTRRPSRPSRELAVRSAEELFVPGLEAIARGID